MYYYRRRLSRTIFRGLRGKLLDVTETWRIFQARLRGGIPELFHLQDANSRLAYAKRFANLFFGQCRTKLCLRQNRQCKQQSFCLTNKYGKREKDRKPRRCKIDFSSHYTVRVQVRKFNFYLCSL